MLNTYITPSDLRRIAAETNIRKHILRDGCEQAADKIERLEIQLDEEISRNEKLGLLAERLKAELAKHQWRTDIENAPRDGTFIDVIVKVDDTQIRIADIVWHKEWNYWVYASGDIYTQFPLAHKITHWKPLDKPEE